MITAVDFVTWLVEATLAGSLALLLALALRGPLRALFGANAAYAAWAVVPVAVLATLLPALPSPSPAAPLLVIQTPVAILADAAPHRALPDFAAWACIAWLCGCAAFVAWLAKQQRRFVRGLGRIADRGDGMLLAEAVAGLPAVVGLLRPRIVMPADALSRYDADERGLMLAHEREHIAHGDLLANAGVLALRCVFWFNPLLHYAARRLRDDQELACDARVIARNPRQRRAYGEAMLKTQLAAQVLPLGCHWGQSHPLKERIEMLKRPTPSFFRRNGGRAVVIAILLAAGYAAWAAQPKTAMAPAPAGKIAADIALRIDDGRPMHMRVLTEPGRAFSARSDEGGKRYAIEGTVTRTRHDGQPALAVELRIAEDDRPLAAPKLVLRNGEPGSIQVGEATSGDKGRTTFKGIRADITLTDSATQPVAAVSLSTPPPVYPVDVMKRGVNGRVVLIVDIAVDGSVSAAKIDRSAGDERLDKAALQAVSQWKFAPAMKEGKPVSSQVRVPIEFEMDAAAAPVQPARAASIEQARNAAANDWGSYDRMVRSLSVSWEPRAAMQEDGC